MTTTRERLQAIANAATEQGFQVTFGWSNASGASYSSITITGLDENDPIVRTIAGFKFERQNDDKWVAFSTESRTPLFELTRQDYYNDVTDETDDDWGVWDVELEDWAHAPQETGYPTKADAIESFARYVSALPGH